MTRRYWILFLCGLSAFAAGSLYAWNSLAAPLAELLACRTGEANLTSSDLSPAFALASSLTPFTMLVSGSLSDRLHPKGLILCGALAMGMGLYQCAQAESVAEVVFSYGVLFGLGLGLVYGSLINYAVKLFADKKGFAGGFVTCGYSLGAVVLPPIVTALYLNIGIDAAFRVLAVATVVIIGAGAFFLTPIARQSGHAATDAERSSVDMTWKQMIATRQFYLVYFFIIATATPALILLSHADYLSGEIGRAHAYALAWLTSIFGVANALGRMSAGAVSDYLGRRKVVLMTLATEMAGLLLLTLHVGSMFAFGVVFALIGYAFGAAMGVMPAWVSDLFGSRHGGLNYGIVITAVSAAGVLGPIGFLYLEQTMQSQSPALLICMVVLAAVAAAVAIDEKIR